MQVGRKITLVIASNVLGALFGYGALLVIGRAFDPAAYGSFLFATGIAGLFSLATTLGLGSAHQQLVARGLPHETILGTAGRLRVLLVLLGLLLTAGFAWGLATFDGPRLTDATTPLVLAGAFAIQILAMARVFLAESWIGLQNVGRPEFTRLVDAGLLLLLLANAGILVRTLAGQWTPLEGIGHWWAGVLDLTQPLEAAQAALLLVACTLLAKLVALLIAVALAVRDGFRFGPYDAAIARRLWSFALPVALSGVIWIVAQYTDVVLLGYFWTSREVGLYGVAQKLAVLAGLAAAAASGVLFSRFSQLSAQQDRHREDRTFREAERWVLLVVAFCVAALVALARPGIHIAVGDPYLPAATTVQLLALATFAFALQVPLTARFMGHGETRILVIAGLVNALVNVALNLIFIPRAGLGWGPAGAAAATALSNLTAWLVLRGHANRRFGTTWLDAPIARTAAAATLVGAGWWQAATWWPEWFLRVWHLGFWGIAGGLAYLGLLALLGGIRRADIQFLRRSLQPFELLRELRGR